MVQRSASRRDDVLGEIARGVGGRAVDLGRVLAGEGAAAMRGRAAIGVDDDLAAGQAAIAVRAADDELAGRIDVPDASVGDPARRQRLADKRLDDLADVFRFQRLVEVLGRDDDLGRRRPACRRRSDGDLGLGVGPERRLAGPVVARLGQQAQDLVA